MFLIGKLENARMYEYEYVIVHRKRTAFYVTFTVVLNWTVVLKCVEECNIQVPYHFGIPKVSGVQKLNDEKNPTSPF